MTGPRHRSLTAAWILLLAISYASSSSRLSAASSEVSRANYRVCIDPGHPSENNDGREVTNGLREVTVNWEIALLLKDLLQKDGFSVVLTKEREDEFVTNKDRALRSNKARTNLFLRLHADAGPANGFTVYYPHRRGTSHGVSGPSDEVLKLSKETATHFHSAFAEALRGKLKDNGLRGEEETLIGSKQGALTGSIFSNVPTVLIEMLFLTSSSDADWIKRSSNKAIMARALASGVRAAYERSR